METSTSIKIFELAEEDRPREKLLLKGKSALSDAELVAILIRTGTTACSAVDLSRMLLASVGNNLAAVARMSVADLTKFKGIGEAKAISIVSALELGRRRKEQDLPKRQKITSSKQVYELMRPDLYDESVEQVYLLLLNRSNSLIKKERVSQGGTTASVVDPKVVFRFALEQGAHSLILIHNHPSGNLQPSESDKRLTQCLQKIGRELELPLLDHLIYTDQGYFSFADEGIM
ncbi:MAG: DNA repair protein RadC [Bacteroidetes bacterium]|nr:DNA repair protein RadC [Bacteroidota bacterium]MDA1268507.1 DNA repair protein RadC [Bacteroidota bacterium]